jgi:hypothetical protein
MYEALGFTRARVDAQYRQPSTGSRAPAAGVSRR